MAQIKMAGEAADNGPELRTIGRPAARDGHAVVVCLNSLLVFGGDRHHMPFNDLHILPLTTFI